MCKVQNHVACQHSTSGKQVRRDGGSEEEGVILVASQEWKQKMSRRQKQEWKWNGEPEGFPLQSHPLQMNINSMQKREIGQKGIEPKVRLWMWYGAPGFLVWNSITFSGAWFLLFRIFFTMYSSSPSMSSSSGGRF